MPEETLPIDSVPTGTVLEKAPVSRHELDDFKLRSLLQETDRLSDLVPYFAFFTVGILLTKGGMAGQDPVQDFMNEAEGEPIISFMNFEHDVFQQMHTIDGDVTWNRRIIAIDRNWWPKALKFLATIGVKDSRQGYFYQALPHSVMVVDPLVVDRHAVVPGDTPLVEVVAFGIDGNRGRLILQAGETPLHPPIVRALPADPKTIQFAQKMLGVT